MKKDIATIVAAYLGHNKLDPTEIPTLISTVSAALADLGKPVAVSPALTRAVSIRRSVQPDAVICVECGWSGSLLKRHVFAQHGLSVDAYREKWSLPADHPMIAPNYSTRRSALAKQAGLGRQGARRRRRRRAEQAANSV